VLFVLLQTVLLADPPIRSVPHLEECTGYGHSALYKAWDEVIQPACGLSLGEFLAWVLLLRALAIKGPDRGWRTVAKRVGVARNRLHDMSMRTYGCSHTEIAGKGLVPVVEFVDRVMVTAGLIGGAELNAPG
jgi:hypothetical protein